MAEVLAAAWAGEHVVHRGEHVTVDGVTFSPRPLQQPRIPMWFAARGSALRPVRRAARYDGLFLIEASVGRPRAGARRGARRCGAAASTGSTSAVSVSPVDDAALLDVPGVTWAMHSMAPVEPLADILEFTTAGPAG